MFPIVPQIVFAGYVAILLAGLVIGLLVGSIFARVLGLHLKGGWKNGLLGGIGALLGFFAAISVPWPENTVTTHFSNGGIMTSTMNRFQHPFWAAFIFAVMLPAVRIVFRFAAVRRRQSLSGKEAS